MAQMWDKEISESRPPEHMASALSTELQELIESKVFVPCSGNVD